jgi:predicted MFS family arabinose efflux permease
MFVLNWTSQYLVEHWKMKKEDIGNLLVVAPLLFDLGAVGFGFAASQREKAGGPPRTPYLLLGISTLLALTLVAAPMAPSKEIAMLIFGAAAAGGGGVYVLVTSDMLARVPVEKTSSAGGMTAAAQSIAHVVAAPIIGRVIDRSGFLPPLVALGLLVVPAVLAFVVWPVGERRAS